jgi:hypothetical protein
MFLLLFHRHNAIMRTTTALNFQLVSAQTHSPILYGFTDSLSVLACHHFSPSYY